MKIRGTRQCSSCDTTWSYYDTGSVACPACGSLKSVGVDAERKQHTDTPVTLDLDESKQKLATESTSIDDIATELSSRLRSYTRKRGFIRGGELLTLDDQYLGAHELIHATDICTRNYQRTELDELYVLELFTAVNNGGRLTHTDIPSKLRIARGAGYTDAVSAYRDDLSTYLESRTEPDAKQAITQLQTQLRRADALEGDIPLQVAETLVEIAREIGTYLIEAEDEALVSARDRLDRLSTL